LCPPRGFFSKVGGPYLWLGHAHRTPRLSRTSPPRAWGPEVESRFLPCDPTSLGGPHLCTPAPIGAFAFSVLSSNRPLEQGTVHVFRSLLPVRLVLPTNFVSSLPSVLGPPPDPFRGAHFVLSSTGCVKELLGSFSSLPRLFGKFASLAPGLSSTHFSFPQLPPHSRPRAFRGK